MRSNGNKKKEDRLLEELREMIGSGWFKQAFRQREQDFTRSRVLSFMGLVVSQIRCLSKSLSVEVSLLVERFFGSEADYTKQAYSQYRSKLKAEAFIALNQQFIQTMGRLSFLYDVENRLAVQALLRPYKASEQDMLLEQLGLLQALGGPAPGLLLLGRGYPSLWLLACLKQRRLDFVMRCKVGFLTETAAFAQSPKQHALLRLDLRLHNRQANKQLQAFLEPGQSELIVRAVKVKLSSGQTELLLTSLKESIDLLGELYHKRWGVETGINFYKNVLEVENFSAKTGLGIRQDFHAGVLTANIAAMLINAAEEELKHQAPKASKHNYQVNRAVALGLVRDKLPDILLGKQPMEQICHQLKEKIKRRKTAIKPGRKFKRKPPLSYKFKQNNRNVI